MIVILQQDVKGTGKKGDVVKVSDGYARNVLIPKGIAKEATEGNVKNLNRQKNLKNKVSFRSLKKNIIKSSLICRWAGSISRNCSRL